MTRSGPKGGPATQITKEWRAAVGLRLDDLGWTPADLAREAGKLLGQEVTRAGISHVLKNATRSGLVPAIERALGWRPADLEKPKLTSVDERGRPASPERQAFMEKLIDDIHRLAGDERQRELVAIFDNLDSDDKQDVLNYSRALYEFRKAEAKRKAAVEDHTYRKIQISRALKETSAQARIAKLDEHLTESTMTQLDAELEMAQARAADVEAELHKLEKDQVDAIARAETGLADSLTTRAAYARDKKVMTNAQKTAAAHARDRARAEFAELRVRRSHLEGQLKELSAEHEDVTRALERSQTEAATLERARKRLGIRARPPS